MSNQACFRHPTGPCCRRALTLVEVIVSIGVIAVLVAILLPAVEAARESARRMQCSNNLKGLGIALHSYHDAHRIFPINTTFNHDVYETGQSRSWMQCVLPWVEQTEISERIKVGGTIVANRAVAEIAIPCYLCPSDSNDGRMDNRAGVPAGWSLGLTNYKSCAGSNWAWGAFSVACPRGRFANDKDGLADGNGLICEGRNGARLTRIGDVTDGTSFTRAIGEAVPRWCKWTWWYYHNGVTATCAIPLNYRTPNVSPEDNWGNWQTNYGFASRHPGGGNFCFADGSVRFGSDEVDLRVYRATATIDGGEATPSF